MRKTYQVSGVIVGILIFISLSIVHLRSEVNVVTHHRNKTDNPIRPTVPKQPGKISAQAEKHIICSGAGCLRLITWLGVQDSVVGVDSIERRGASVDARPYALANPRFASLPLFGEFRGRDNAELIAALSPAPQIIFKTTSTPDAAQKLFEKTGVPVFLLEYGNLTYGRASLENSLKKAGNLLQAQKRAQQVIEYFRSLEDDLKRRTASICQAEQISAYLGGVAMKGPQDLLSTDPDYAPFSFTNTKNVAAPLNKKLRVSHGTIAKEQLLAWDPQVIFIDVATTAKPKEQSGVYQLFNEPEYQSLSAVKNKRIHFLFPIYSYHQNFDTAFANAYYIGKVLYPDRFSDIEPMKKAEEISIFLNGGKAFDTIAGQYHGLPFSQYTGTVAY